MSGLNLQDMPPEIFLRILSYLPPMELAERACVCRIWNEISMDNCLWKYHCLTTWRYWRLQEQIESKDASWYQFFKSNCAKSNLTYLIIGAEGGGVADERLLDVQKKLKLEGLVNVDVCNVRSRTPTFEYLQKYNGIMFFSYHGFDQTSIGNMLADYAEAGGGVVFCAYANCGRGNRLGGKWFDKKYDPLSLGATSRSPNLNLGKRVRPRHPILYGVDALDGGDQSSHGDGVPHNDAKMIAEWSNGRPLAVELGGTSTRTGLIVGLNMYPPSSDVALGGWKAHTCGALLMANALFYVARGISTADQEVGCI